jgi:hypothetical protein
MAIWVANDGTNTVARHHAYSDKLHVSAFQNLLLV